MIPYEERKVIYEKAITHYGMRSQVWMAVEEMSELLKELAKLNRPEGTTSSKLADEIADVTVMLEQLRIMFGVNELVQDRIDYKVKRLAQRIKEDQEGRHGRLTEE